MNTKSAPLPCDSSQPALHLRDLLFLFFAQAGLVQHLCYLIAGEDIAGQVFIHSGVVLTQIGAASILEKQLAFLQEGKKFIQQRHQFLQGKAKSAMFVPNGGVIHAALEVRHADHRALFDGFHHEQLKQNAFPASGRTSEENVRCCCQVYSHKPSKAASQHQHKILVVQETVFPWKHNRQRATGRHNSQAHGAVICPLLNRYNVNIQRTFQFFAVILKLSEMYAVGKKSQHLHSFILLVSVDEDRMLSCCVFEANSLNVLCDREKTMRQSCRSRAQNRQHYAEDGKCNPVQATLKRGQCAIRDTQHRQQEQQYESYHGNDCPRPRLTV